MKQFRRGPWTVITPILVHDESKSAFKALICPHPTWQIKESGPVVDDKKEYVIDPSIGEPIFSVTEVCPLCGSVRFRYIPLAQKDEPFDYAIPTKEPWYERLYDFGNFRVLSRRLLPRDETIDYLVRVETPGGQEYATIYKNVGTELFAPSVAGFLEMMGDVARIGPEQYASFRILKEGRKTKRAKEEVKQDATAMASLFSEIGQESLQAAQGIMEGEPEREAADMEEWQIGMMEQEAKLRREALQKRRPPPR